MPFYESRLGRSVVAERTDVQLNLQMRFSYMARSLTDLIVAEATSIEVLHYTGRQFPVDPAGETAIVPLGDGRAVQQEIGTRQYISLITMSILDVRANVTGAGVMGKVTDGTLVETGFFEVMTVHVDLSILGFHLLEAFLAGHLALVIDD